MGICVLTRVERISRFLGVEMGKNLGIFYFWMKMIKFGFFSTLEDNKKQASSQFEKVYFYLILFLKLKSHIQISIYICHQGQCFKSNTEQLLEEHSKELQTP